MAYRSEIRDSVKERLIEKVSKDNYQYYLKKIRFNKARMLENQMIRFDFPVTALIGPNGGGKTTVLGAAGCIYKSIKPNQFFAKSGRLDEGMANWKIEYTIIDKSIRKDDTIRRSASYRSHRWKRGALSRETVFFGVSRTVPANERIELRKCASPSYKIDDRFVVGLSEIVKNAVGKILGKNIDNYNSITIDPKGKVTLLTGETETVKYSEFHFGAGESSIIRMVMGIESAPNGSLILIEEIENGLHPVATIRLVEYLIDVSSRRNNQIIFSTHSNDALQPLPDCAIWASVNGTLIQGKLNINSLRAITGQIETQLAIFVEDEFAKAWTIGAARAKGDIDLDCLEVHAMLGDGTAVAVNRYHNKNPSTPFPSICIVDGDSQQKESDDEKVYRLPGEAPELYIYDKVLDVIAEVKGKLAVALHRPFEAQHDIESVVKSIRTTNRDPHVLFSQVGERAGLISEDTVRDAFIYIWSVHFPEEVDGIVKPIKELLPHTE